VGDWDQTSGVTNFTVIARIESHRRKFPIPVKVKIAQKAYDDLERPEDAPKYMDMIYLEQY